MLLLLLLSLVYDGIKVHGRFSLLRCQYCKQGAIILSHRTHTYTHTHTYTQADSHTGTVRLVQTATDRSPVKNVAEISAQRRAATEPSAA